MQQHIFLLDDRAVYEIMWKNILESYRPQNTTWRMHISFWIPMATDTLSQYVMLIAFPLQQWLQESASVLLYRYIVCHFVLDRGCLL